MRGVSYLRVSTDRQGVSGLGLDAQRATVLRFLGRDPLEEFVEVESGRRADRPQLARALARCRALRAPLIVANVSRLTRSVAFLSRLIESGVDVRFCDLPEVAGATGRFLLVQLAAIAELEAGMISERTRAALAAAKARGKRLGKPENLRNGEVGRQVAIERRKASAAARRADVAPFIEEARAAGASSLRAIARHLNEAGVSAPRGGAWSASQVRRLEA